MSGAEQVAVWCMQLTEKARAWEGTGIEDGAGTGWWEALGGF